MNNMERPSMRRDESERFELSSPVEPSGQGSGVNEEQTNPDDQQMSTSMLSGRRQLDAVSTSEERRECACIKLSF